MSTEIKTHSKEEPAKFIIEHADQLENKAIEIGKKDGRLVAELFDTDEPST